MLNQCDLEIAANQNVDHAAILAFLMINTCTEREEIGTIFIAFPTFATTMGYCCMCVLKFVFNSSDTVVDRVSSC